MTNTTEPFALLDFVSHDETRPAILKPWRYGDYVYATDGRIMVRASCELFPSVTMNADTPKADAEKLQTQADKLLVEPPADEHWMPPTEEMRAMKPVQCDQCVDGLRECESCGHSAECDYCDGSGKRVPHTKIRAGSVILNGFYLEKLCRLPGVMLHIPPNRQALDAVPFRFNHGIGVLMPMRTP